MTILSADKFKSNAHLIETVRALGYFDHAGLTVDVTWGRGTWWKRYQPPRFQAHDKYTLDGVDYHALPYGDASVTLVAFDPSYVAPGGRVSSGLGEFNQRYGLDRVGKRPSDIEHDVRRALREIDRVLEPGGVCLHKTANYVSSGRLQLSALDSVAAGQLVGWKVADLLTHVGPARPQPAGRRVVHARQNTSWLIIWRKPGRRPHHSAARRRATGNVTPTSLDTKVSALA